MNHGRFLDIVFFLVLELFNLNPFPRCKTGKIFTVRVSQLGKNFPHCNPWNLFLCFTNYQCSVSDFLIFENISGNHGQICPNFTFCIPDFPMFAHIATKTWPKLPNFHFPYFVAWKVFTFRITKRKVNPFWVI